MTYQTTFEGDRYDVTNQLTLTAEQVIEDALRAEDAEASPDDIRREAHNVATAIWTDFAQSEHPGPLLVNWSALRRDVRIQVLHGEDLVLKVQEDRILRELDGLEEDLRFGGF